MTNLPTTLFAERDYPSQLLEAASYMISSKRYEVSVVTTQMACEICAERVLRRYFAARDVRFLESPVDDLLPSYNLANEKVRNVYIALTGDPIHQQFFCLSTR